VQDRIVAPCVRITVPSRHHHQSTIAASQPACRCHRWVTQRREIRWIVEIIENQQPALRTGIQVVPNETGRTNTSGLRRRGSVEVGSQFNGGRQHRVHHMPGTYPENTRPPALCHLRDLLRDGGLPASAKAVQDMEATGFKCDAEFGQLSLAPTNTGDEQTRWVQANRLKGSTGPGILSAGPDDIDLNPMTQRWGTTSHDAEVLPDRRAIMLDRMPLWIISFQVHDSRPQVTRLDAPACE
jgi:hypothetical protein